MLGLPTSHSEHLGSVGQEAIDNSANSVSSGSSSAMTRQPKTDALKSGMFEVVEASVQQASTWEKKAMAVVDELRKPSRYDVSWHVVLVLVLVLVLVSFVRIRFKLAHLISSFYGTYRFL
jgi:hypothetical protein